MSITREQVRQYYRDRHEEYIKAMLSITSKVQQEDITNATADLVVDIANDLAIATPTAKVTAPFILLALETVFNGIKSDMSAEQQIVYSETSEAIIKSGRIIAETDE